MEARMSFPDRCRGCGGIFQSDEERVGIVRAGSAWQGLTDEEGRSVALLEDGAELFSTESWHIHHAPSEAS